MIRLGLLAKHQNFTLEEAGQINTNVRLLNFQILIWFNKYIFNPEILKILVNVIFDVMEVMEVTVHQVKTLLLQLSDGMTTPRRDCLTKGTMRIENSSVL